MKGFKDFPQKNLILLSETRQVYQVCQVENLLEQDNKGG